MGKIKKQNYRPFQTEHGGHFLQIYDDMLNSKAWQELTANDIVLYLYMLSKFKVRYSHNEVDKTNEDNISVPQSEYTKLMNNRTFFKSIDHLISLGFIKVIRSGYSTRQCNLYGFCSEWQKYGTDSFNIKAEWLRPKSRMQS